MNSLVCQWRVIQQELSELIAISLQVQYKAHILAKIEPVTR